MRVFDISIIIFKFLSLFAFTSIFLFWSITAIIKYKSGKAASSVSFRYGDDGHGNIYFPAITICLDSFKWISISPNGMKKNCPKTMKTFGNALAHCTGTDLDPEIASNWSKDEKEKKLKEITLFTEIDDFIEAAKMLEISDIVASFQWKGEPKLHIVRGFCYTFESKEVPVYMKDGDLFKKLSKLELEIDVSFILYSESLSLSH